jgi:hypothetical protein
MSAFSAPSLLHAGHAAIDMQNIQTQQQATSHHNTNNNFYTTRNQFNVQLSTFTSHQRQYRRGDGFRKGAIVGTFPLHGAGFVPLKYYLCFTALNSSDKVFTVRYELNLYTKLAYFKVQRNECGE